ncbi:MAG: site-specific integrase, partial [Thermoanaerobaculia bacterium]
MKLPGFSYDPKRRVAVFYAYVPGSAGRKRRLRTYADVPSQAAALRLYGEYRQQLEREAAGHAGPGPVPTLRAFVGERFDEMTLRIRPSTRRYYRDMLDTHLLPALGTRKLDEITSVRANGLIGSLLQAEWCPRHHGCARGPSCTESCRPKRYSGATVNGVVRVLKIVLNWAVELDVLPMNPCRKKIKYAPVERPELEMSLEERDAFLRTFDDLEGFRRHLAANRVEARVVQFPCCAGEKKVGGSVRPDGEAATTMFERYRLYKPFFLTLLSTGLRLSDAMGLSWSSVSLDEGLLHVVTAKRRKLVTVPLPDVLRAEIVALRRRPMVSERVFLDENLRPLTVQKVRRKFQLAKQLAGIERRLRIHDLRHTYASTLVSAGVNLKVVSDLLGHQDIKTTAVYARGDRRALESVRTVL